MSPKKSSRTRSDEDEDLDLNADPPPPFGLPRTPSPSPGPPTPAPSQLTLYPSPSPGPQTPAPSQLTPHASPSPHPQPQTSSLYSAGDVHAPPGRPFVITETDPEPNPYDYVVEFTLLNHFHSAPRNASVMGWTEAKWYVVLKGFRPGIYYDFW